MDRHPRHPRCRAPFTPRLVFGLGVMAVGLLLTLDNLGVLEARHYWRFWPLILVATGVARAAQSMGEGHRPMGLGLALFGVFLLLVNLDVLRFRHLWPALFLLAGGTIVWKVLTRPADGGPVRETSSSFSAYAVMGGVRRGTSAQDFERGEATAVMGGCEIDLSRASMKGDTAVFDTFALWGGVEIRVPEDWAVENRGVALLGGFEDKTHGPSVPEKRLILTGLAIMGGVEVKN